MTTIIDPLHTKGPRQSHQRLPYWTCDGKKYHSKIHALIVATQTRSHDIQFHFNDEILSGCNWYIEPSENIDYYYDLRAKSLRDKYDYLVLMYSGGSDSSTMLKSFLRSGLYIDEVATYGVWNHTVDKYYTLDNFEVTYSAADMLRKCAAQGIRVNHINLLDGISMLDNDDWIWSSDISFMGNQICRYKPVYMRDDLRRMVAAGKKVAVVIGHDKPRVVYRDRALWYAMVDAQGIGTGIYPEFYSDEYDGPDVELFHANVDVPEIMIKQTHLIIKYYMDKFSGKIKTMLNQHSYDPYCTGRMNEAIYPTTWRQTETYTLGKGKQHLDQGMQLNAMASQLTAFEWRQDWLYDRLGDTNYCANWYAGIKKAVSMIDERFIDKKDVRIYGTWTKFYHVMNFND